MKLFKDFSLSFDYFIENRKDILIARSSVPSFQGVPVGNIPRVNMGKIKIKVMKWKRLIRRCSIKISLLS